MKEEISICKLLADTKTLVILDTKMLTTHLDEELVELYVIYKRKRYTVHGNYLMPYIIVEEVGTK